MFDRIGAFEVGVIAVLFLIFFGGKKLPEFIRGLGQSVKEFRKGLKDGD